MLVIATALSTLLQFEAAANDPPSRSRSAELVTIDESSILYAYEDDDIVAEVALSPGGLQASFDGLFIDAEIGADGTVEIQCSGEPCTEAELLEARAQLSVIAELVIQSPPEASKLKCALHIVGGAAACAGSYGGLCLLEFYLAACACMDSVVINGKDICAEIS